MLQSKLYNVVSSLTGILVIVIIITASHGGVNCM